MAVGHCVAGRIKPPKVQLATTVQEQERGKRQRAINKGSVCAPRQSCRVNYKKGLVVQVKPSGSAKWEINYMPYNSLSRQPFEGKTSDDLGRDERVREGLVDGHALRGINDETLVQKVFQLVHLFEVSVLEGLVANKVREEVGGGRNGGHLGHLLLRRREREREREREGGREGGRKGGRERENINLKFSELTIDN